MSNGGWLWVRGLVFVSTFMVALVGVGNNFSGCQSWWGWPTRSGSESAYHEGPGGHCLPYCCRMNFSLAFRIILQARGWAGAPAADTGSGHRHIIFTAKWYCNLIGSALPPGKSAGWSRAEVCRTNPNLPTTQYCISNFPGSEKIGLQTAPVCRG